MHNNSNNDEMPGIGLAFCTVSVQRRSVIAIQLASPSVFIESWDEHYQSTGSGVVS